MKYFFILLFTISQLYAYEWTAICDEDYSINGFVQNFEGNYPFVLACDEGILLKNGDDWILETYGGLPVWDVLLCGVNEFLLVQGCGSNSDGVYKFDENSFQFEIIDWMDYPNFLVYNESHQEYYIGALDGLHKSPDGETWELVSHFSGMNCVDMVFLGNHYAVSVTGNIFGVHYSDDYGASWNAPTPGSPLITDLSFRNDSTLFGIFPDNSFSSGLWSSTDWGATWQVEFWDLNLSSVCNDMDGNTFVGWESDTGVALWENQVLTPINYGLQNLCINELFVNPVMSVIHIMAFTDCGAYIMNDYLTSDPVLPITEINLSNYPNPFNPSTTISFSLTQEITEDTELVVYNLRGQKVKTFPVILSGVEESGNDNYSVTWNGTDDNNKPVASGVYFYKLKASNFEKSNKMLLLK